MIDHLERSFKSDDGRDGRFAFIPEPMRKADRWAVAASDKVPHDPRTGRRASSNDPSTWATFDEACAALGDRFDRLYFAAGDGFAFADFDGCVIDGEIHAAVNAAVADADSYAEISPSGNGVRIWATTDDTSQEWRKHYATPWAGPIEVYKAGQFGSVTGKVLHNAPLNDNGTVDGVMARFPRPVDSTDYTAPDEPISPPMDDDEVIRRLRTDRNGEVFSALYDTPTDPDEDASAGDQSLFSRIAFYTQDRAQIERIAFDSERVRDKWQRPDYIRRTIDKALQRSDFWTRGGTLKIADKGAKGDNSGHTQAGEGDPFAFVDLTTVATEPPDMLVEGLISRGSVVSIYSGAGTGKTWTALYALAQTVARGEKAVYVDKENGARIIRERLGLMGVNLEATKHLIRYIPFPTAGLDGPTVEAWAAMLDREKPALVIFDSWIGFLASCGLDENSSNDVATWADKYATPAARERGVAVLILDHEPKAAGNKTARGSSRKLDYVDAQFKQTVTAPFDRSTVGSVKLSKQKDREGWLPSALHFRAGGKRGELDGSRIGRDSFVFSPVDMPDSAPEDGLNGGERATLSALVDGMSYAEWHGATGKASSTFNVHRDKLVRLGLVIRDEDAGTYSRPQLQQLQNDSKWSDWSSCQDRPYNSNYSNDSKSWSSWSTDGGQSVVDNLDPAAYSAPWSTV